MMDSELNSLISAACDNIASEKQLARLAERLRENPESRDEYIRYVDLHAALADEAIPALESDIVDYPLDAMAKPAFDKREVPANLGPWTGAPRNRSFRWLWGSAMGSAVVLACVFLVNRPTAKDPNAVANVAPIATMLLSENCAWQGVDISEGERLYPGRVDLIRGTAILRFDGGAELALVAPAAMDLQSAGRALVHYGDAVVRAVNGAEGFAVTTPTSEVVDLGTEFAVKVSRSGETELHVLDGEVSYRGIHVQADLAKILSAGQGVAIDHRGLPRAVPMNSPRFQEYVNRVNPRSRADLLSVYEGFNYSPGILALEDSSVGKGWAGPWRRRLADERRFAGVDKSPEHFEIVHGQMNVTWPVPGGRLGMLKLPAGGAYYVRPLKQPINMNQDAVTFFSLMVRETAKRTDAQRPYEQMRLTFRSSQDYHNLAVSFGHGPRYRPTVRTGNGVAHRSLQVLPAGETTLWVGKIVARRQGEDEIYFRVYGEDDVLGYAEPASWHVATRAVSLDARLDRVLLSSMGKTSRFVDELRIGPTWRSVAPIQEVAE